MYITDTRRLTDADPMLPDIYRVTRRTRDTYDTFTLELRAVDRGRQIVFAPGQFNMLYVFGVGEVPISISGDPEQNQQLVHTIRAIGTVTNAMRKLRSGDSLGVRGPYGTAWPVAEAKGRDVLLIAGGIGLAPLRPVLYYLLNHRHDYGRIVLLHGARTPADLLYRKELERWRGRFDIQVRATVDNADGDWLGNVGVVTQLIAGAHFDAEHTLAMICGPEVMMRFTVIELEKRGVDLAQIYVSMERNMKCGVGFCGHCQFGPEFICKNGPVFAYSHIESWIKRREV